MKIKVKSVITSFIACSLLLTSIFAFPVSAAESSNISAISISTTGSDSGIMPMTVPGYYGVTADVLSVRSGPGTQYARVGYLYYGDAVLVTSISNGWAKFLFHGVYRYAHCDYLEEYKG